MKGGDCPDIGASELRVVPKVQNHPLQRPVSVGRAILAFLAGVALSGCTAYHIKPVGEIPGTSIAVHSVVALESGVACGALTFTEAGKLLTVTGGCVEGSLAGPAALLGKIGGAVAGALLVVTPQELEQERNRKVAER